MPWVETGEDGGPDFYQNRLYQAVTWDDDEIAFLLSEKKRYTQERDEWIAAQKPLGAKIGKAKKAGLYLVEATYRPDFEKAKERATEAMKCYRACCYIVGQIAGDPPGDCRSAQATKELAPYIDRIFATMDLYSSKQMEARQWQRWEQMGEARP